MLEINHMSTLFSLFSFFHLSTYQFPRYSTNHERIKADRSF